LRKIPIKALQSKAAPNPFSPVIAEAFEKYPYFLDCFANETGKLHYTNPSYE